MATMTRCNKPLSIKYLWQEGFTLEVTHPDILRGIIKRGLRPTNCEISRLPETPQEARWLERCMNEVHPPKQEKIEKMENLRATFYNDEGEMLQKPYCESYTITCDKQIMNFVPTTISFNRPPSTKEESDWCKKCESMVKPPKILPEIRAGRVEIAAKSKAKSDKLGLGLILIPMYSIYRIGKIFIEGLRYGRDNWKKGVFDTDYQEERLEHAFNHLMLYKERDTSEDHLAKVAWFCITQMELQRLEKEGLKNDSEQL